MHATFTGNTKRPRNVNLSGRVPPNPWANLPGSSTASTSNTLATAQAEREKRQRERERLNRTRTLQRVARGRAERKRVRAGWRAQWDRQEEGDLDEVEAGLGLYGFLERLQNGGGAQGERVWSSRPYNTEAEVVSQLHLLVFFAQPSHDTDRYRIAYFGRRLQKSMEKRKSSLTAREASLLRRLARLTIEAVRSIDKEYECSDLVDLLQLLGLLSTIIPNEIAASLAQPYLGLFADMISGSQELNDDIVKLIVHDVLQIMVFTTANIQMVYIAFAVDFMSLPNLEERLGTDSCDQIIGSIDYNLLASALVALFETQVLPPSIESTDRRLWLLARFIYAHNQECQSDNTKKDSQDAGYIRVVSTLLNSIADEVSARLEVLDTVMHINNDPGSRRLPQPLPPFIRTQINSLVQQSNISNLLTQTITPGKEAASSGNAQALATYALTLLRVFPGKADDIRMWLYLGSNASPKSSGKRISAIRFFWQSARRTDIFTQISKDQKLALTLLKPPAQAQTTKKNTTTTHGLENWNKDWQVILLFLELYTFILKLMDDEEFLSGGETQSLNGLVAQFRKEGALPLTDVKDMTVFLKNLAFTLYWNASDLAESESVPDGESIRNYFASTESPKPEKKVKETQKTQGLAGMLGVAQDYLKGLVTGLLRMIHERDSRRGFLPKDHWLMTNSVDMTGFIPAVVAEEEKRHLISEDDEEDDDDVGDDMLDSSTSAGHSNHALIGTRREQQTRQLEMLKRKQERVMRRRMLESVAPRLEILRNLPFFIPFDTRVQIFREFVDRDQQRRRKGFVDPDTWRMSVMHGSGLGPDGRPAGHEIISRHHAEIRRDATFESAFENFYELGDGLKEPIQISFIDQFNSVEAGIDGGGVTKEFLTSVTNEAFDPTSMNLFVENDKHLLYPNPGALEERKELLRQAQFVEGSLEWREQLADLLRRYEFLGRIIGKCMYEGILVDVNFAGFFLLKWALTGGTTTASNESAYKPNLNDLRDLDEGLYQGLLQLKNYTGNVEDFSLNFSITDKFNLPEVDSTRHTKSIDHDLIRNGSSIPVTNRNRLQYISLVTRHRLRDQQYYQTKGFLSGLGQMISPTWLSMFNQSELQTLVSGDTSGEIDIEDLRANTLYGGVYVLGDDGIEHPTIQLFWQAMRSLSHSERRAVLKFVTSTPRAPLGGFSHLNPRFSIRDSGPGEGEEGENRLPSTSTCVNLLKLPRYRRLEGLRGKLLYAVNSGAGFDLS